MPSKQAQQNELRKRIENYSYGLNDRIGVGFSSTVYRGANESTKDQVAIKVIDLKSIRTKQAKELLEAEIFALKRLAHRNVLRCLDIYTTTNNCYIMTQFCNGGDLEHLLKKRGKLSEAEAIPLIRDILTGYRNIADNGLLHRDIKPSNIFLKDHVAKIADFGFTKQATGTVKERCNIGTPLYMSPQSLNSNQYSQKSDIWSIGVLLYEMLHGKVPWNSKDQKQLKTQIELGVAYFSESLSADLKQFISKCLIASQSERMDYFTFINHPFMLRITESNGIPELLRKPTTIVEDLKPNVSIDSENRIDLPGKNSQKELVSLHHRRTNKEELQIRDQLIETQFHWVQFLSIVLSTFSENLSDHSLKIRFIITKQLFSHLKAISQSLEEGNPFNIENWREFIEQPHKKQKYLHMLKEMERRHSRHLSSYKSDVKNVIRDQKTAAIADTNFDRSQFLSILGIHYCLQECKQVWSSIRVAASQRAKEFPNEVKYNCLKLDFLMSYYQLNCFLIDDFEDPRYFQRMSKLEDIVENPHGELGPPHLKLLEQKLLALKIIK